MKYQSMKAEQFLFFFGGWSKEIKWTEAKCVCSASILFLDESGVSEKSLSWVPWTWESTCSGSRRPGDWYDYSINYFTFMFRSRQWYEYKYTFQIWKTKVKYYFFSLHVTMFFFFKTTLRFRGTWSWFKKTKFMMPQNPERCFSRAPME